jgi:hypothetical protein
LDVRFAYEFLRLQFCRRHIAVSHKEDALKILRYKNKTGADISTLKKKFLETFVAGICYKMLPPDGRLIIARN